MNEKSFEFSALEGSTSLSRARIGDLSIIIERLRSDATLLIEERILIAEILGGDWTRPANRPPALDAELRNEQIKEDALLNRALDPKGRPGATRVAHAHRCSPKWVYKLLADVDADPKSHAAMHKRVGRKVALYQSIMAKLAKEAVQGAHDGVAAADP